MKSLNNLQGLENIKSKGKNKKANFDYEFKNVNSWEYQLEYIFKLENNMLKRILKLSMRSAGVTINKKNTKNLEDQEIEFHKAYTPYLNRFMKQPFNIVKDLLKTQEDVNIKTYEVNKAFFIVNNDLKEWEVHIKTSGHYIDLLE